MQVLTVSSIVELVDLTSSKVFTPEEKEIKLDLSFEKAKLAVLGLHDSNENKFPFEFNEETIEVDNVAIDQKQVIITWRLKGSTLPIGYNFSIDEYLQYTTKAVEGNETLKVIKSLKDEFDNFTPLYEIRNRLKHLTRKEQDEAIFDLMREDVIELSKLNEPWLYSDEQCAAGIPTPVGGNWFFVILN